MKFFPWILALIFAVAAGILFTNGKRNETELAQLHQENTELSQTRVAIEATKNAETQSEKVEFTRREREELIRLRNEVGQLRREKQQLSTQFQQAQQRNEQLLQSQQLQQAQHAQQLQKQIQQTAQQTEEQQIIQARNQCINNLRQIDGATQQWALEKKQAANATVVVQEILAYLRNSTLPVCPSGGAYSITTVESTPTCNIPGHTIEN